MTKASDDLAKALREFHESYRKEISAAPREDAKSAKELVDQAKAILRDSGVGTAFVSRVLDAVKHWHAWSQRPDFQQYMQFPASEVTGSDGRDATGKNKITTANFTYRGTPYQVKLVDGGFQSGFDEPYHHAATELRSGDELVLGLNIAQDLNGTLLSWKWFDVYAFSVGDWMRDVLEMAAHIEAKITNQIQESSEQDVIARASRIKL